jgi:very-short-patch-repair endonuclease
MNRTAVLVTGGNEMLQVNPRKLVKRNSATYESVNGEFKIEYRIYRPESLLKSGWYVVRGWNTIISNKFDSVESAMDFYAKAGA